MPPRKKKCLCSCHRVNQGLQKPNTQEIHCNDCATQHKAALRKRRESAPKRRSETIKTLDDMFSIIVRVKANWTCVKCGKYFQPEYDNHFKPRNRLLTNSHYFGRGNIMLRWDLRNCDALCLFCHMKVENNKTMIVEGFCYKDFMVVKLTEIGYDKLEEENRNRRKVTLFELSVLKSQMVGQLRETLGEYHAKY
jgi:hypothetical protein